MTSSATRFVAPIMLVVSHRFIGGNHNKVFNPVLGRRKGDLPRAEDVVLDSCEDMLLHHRNMLIGGGVVQNRRLILLHHTSQVIGARDYCRSPHERPGAGK